MSLLHRTLFALALLPALLSAQNLTAPLLSGSWQSTYHNPAMLHFLPGEVTVGLPGVANDLQLENIHYNDLFVDSGSGGRRILSLAALAALTDDRNEVQDVFSIETLGVALRRGPFSLSAYHRLRVEGEAEYRGALVDLFVLGNAPFIGTTLEISPRGRVVSFQELGLGLSYAINDVISLGGRLKYLAGTSTVSTAPGGSLRLTTGSENYALTLEQDLTLRTVGALEYNGQLNEVELIYEPNRLSPGELFSGNTGLGMDLGVAADLGRLRLNFSATDLGARISWKEEVTTLRFSGKDTFTGLDVLEDLLRDSISLDEALDSLVLTFDPETNADPYRTELSPRYYLGGEYDLTSRLTAGALLVVEERLGSTTAAVAVTGRYAATDWLRVGLNVNHRAGLRTNVGMHLYATPGRFQFFASSDKLFTLLGTGSPALSGIRLGAGLTFGSRADAPASARPGSR
ncbi:opacity protein-like surface antigen [Lewinella marina]|uniref:DUF5723 domain-containing protein n=1 Tax=Neolewinella marina TaxID=438751 RepID=A0A2G0CEJ8_9BACT|nr:DUF5723 family protein [Neolewinella marina]NJB87270.1 opacity protein-like surface antigen [Neolewinella marina]PHK98406.1 hypothetical protein CGL56_11980 [Neolewinella marina]